MTWYEYFKKWLPKLVRDSVWEVQCEANSSLKVPEIRTNAPVRSALISYNPEAVANEQHMVHEFSHLLLSRMVQIFNRMTDEMPPDKCKLLRSLYNDAEEETCEVLAEIFMRLEKQ